MGYYAGGANRNNIPPLQTVVQLNVYRQKDGRFEYLLLKRIDADSKFWQVVTEPVPSSSTLGDVLRQAASGQIGVRGFKHLSHETYSYEWYTHGERGRDIVFAAEISPEAIITLDHTRYNEFVWLPIDEASRRLKWDGNRAALRRLDDHLAETYPANPRSQSLINTPPSSGPYGPNIPRRLPDQSSAVAATPVREINPGELFL